MRRHARQALKRALPVLSAVAFAYAALPYVTLYRLGYAIQHGDSAALETLVDWDGVREGLKEDVCDALADEPDPGAATVAAHDESVLPAFGSGFVRGIAANSIDNNVTPRAIVAAAGAGEAAVHDDKAQPQIEWAFFDSPTTFSVVLRPPGKHANPIRLQMELRDHGWKITRAWLPRELLMRANERT